MSISGQSLGLIETIGLATAIEAADAAIVSSGLRWLPRRIFPAQARRDRAK